MRMTRAQLPNQSIRDDHRQCTEEAMWLGANQAQEKTDADHSRRWNSDPVGNPSDNWGGLSNSRRHGRCGDLPGVEWDANGSSATPIASLSREEIATLAGFVRYWLDDDTEGFRFSSETPNISFRK